MDKLADLVYEVEPEAVIWKAADSASAYKCAMEHTIDVFLVDIVLDSKQRGDVSGAIFVKNIKNYGKYYFTPIIIITYVEDISNYFFHELHCFDYIERPYDSLRLKQVIKKALRYTTLDNECKQLYLRQNRIFYHINCEDILYAQVVNRAIYIYMADGEYFKSMYRSMARLLDDSDCPHLMQCSRSTVVNIKCIESIDITNRYISLTNGDVIDIGITYVSRIREIIYTDRGKDF